MIGRRGARERKRKGRLKTTSSLLTAYFKLLVDYSYLTASYNFTLHYIEHTLLTSPFIFNLTNPSTVNTLSVLRFRIMCLPNATPKDGTSDLVWLFEAPTSRNNTSSLSDDGVEFIARHKYKPGHYTFLDNFFNPFWSQLTEYLPMTLAPNMVTFIGALHCWLAYCVLWYHAPHYDNPVPNWTIFLAGYCTIAYYTFDCMDGKQARRTGASVSLTPSTILICNGCKKAPRDSP